MNSRRLLLIAFLSAGSTGWAADFRQDLSQARASYHQAVAQHGEHSPEARAARARLRTSRRTFHAERRRRKKE